MKENKIKRKMSSLKKWLLFLAITFCSFMLIFGILAFLVLDTGKLVIIKVKTSETLMSDYLGYQAKGGSWVLNDADLNTITQLLVKEGTVIGPATVKSVDVSLQEDKANVRIFAYLNGMLIRIESKMLIYENESSINVQPLDLKIGKLKLPLDVAYSILGRIAPSFLIVDGVYSLPKETLPESLLNLSLQNSTMILEWKKPEMIVPVDPTPTAPTAPTKPTTPTTPTPAQTTKDLLISTNKQLSVVASKTSSAGTKTLISSIRTSISKVIENPSYDITSDSASVKAMYSNLTEAERSEFKTLILTNMNTNNLLKLQQMFKL